MTARWLGSINSTDAKHLPKPRSPSSVIPLARCPSDDGALISSMPFWFPKEIRPHINQTFLDASTPTLYSGPRTGLTSQLTARSLTPRGASSTGSLPPVHHRSPSPERRRSASPPVRADKARRARDVNGSRVGLFVGTPDKISRQIDSGLADYDQALRISVPPSPRSEQLRLPPANPYSDGAYPVLRSRAEPMPASRAAPACSSCTTPPSRRVHSARRARGRRRRRRRAAPRPRRIRRRRGASCARRARGGSSSLGSLMRSTPPSQSPQPTRSRVPSAGPVRATTERRPSFSGPAAAAAIGITSRPTSGAGSARRRPPAQVPPLRLSPAFDHAARRPNAAPPPRWPSSRAVDPRALNAYVAGKEFRAKLGMASLR